MKRLLISIACIVLAPVAAASGGAFTSLHPEEAIPDPRAQVSVGPHDDFIKQVQAKLRQLGFDAGPVNGDFGEKTQAALAQFQLSRIIPASGQLDDLTLAELGVAREDVGTAAAGR
jgi:peptidoglycan hydrolase-like protein with peptidoglycan-binding domain